MRVCCACVSGVYVCLVCARCVCVHLLVVCELHDVHAFATYSAVSRMFIFVLAVAAILTCLVHTWAVCVCVCVCVHA